MSTSGATVFLVDDDDSVRRAVARLLVSAGYQVEVFKSGQELLAAGTDKRDAACIVLDLQMPGLSGLDLQRELRDRDVSLPIVFITGHGDIPSSVRAMKAGAVDFLSKPFSDNDLLHAVEEALARNARERSQSADLTDLRGRAAKLTSREREVMTLVAQGLMNKQIAARLGTVEKTIKVHRGRVMKKMQVATLADLVRAVERLHATPSES